MSMKIIPITFWEAEITWLHGKSIEMFSDGLWIKFENGSYMNVIDEKYDESIRDLISLAVTYPDEIFLLLFKELSKYSPEFTEYCILFYKHKYFDFVFVITFSNLSLSFRGAK